MLAQPEPTPVRPAQSDSSAQSDPSPRDTPDSAPGSLTLEIHGFLADRLAPLGRRRGTRIIVGIPHPTPETAQATLTALVASDPRYGLLFDVDRQRLPEHVEVVLNDRVLDLQGGLLALVSPGDTLTFLPAHAGGAV